MGKEARKKVDEELHSLKMRVLILVCLALAVTAESLPEKIAASRAAQRQNYVFAEIVEKANPTAPTKPMSAVQIDESMVPASPHYYGQYSYAPHYQHPYYAYAHAIRFGQVAPPAAAPAPGAPVA